MLSVPEFQECCVQGEGQLLPSRSERGRMFKLCGRQSFSAMTQNISYAPRHGLEAKKQEVKANANRTRSARKNIGRQGNKYTENMHMYTQGRDPTWTPWNEYETYGTLFPN